jgi:hypothetical protein
VRIEKPLEVAEDLLAGPQHRDLSGLPHDGVELEDRHAVTVGERARHRRLARARIAEDCDAHMTKYATGA